MAIFLSSIVKYLINPSASWKSLTSLILILFDVAGFLVVVLSLELLLLHPTNDIDKTHVINRATTFLNIVVPPRYFSLLLLYYITNYNYLQIFFS